MKHMYGDIIKIRVKPYVIFFQHQLQCLKFWAQGEVQINLSLWHEGYEVETMIPTYV